MKKITEWILGPNPYQGMDHFEESKSRICIHLSIGFIASGIIGFAITFLAGMHLEAIAILPTTLIAFYLLYTFKKHKNVDLMVKSMIMISLTTLGIMNFALGSTIAFALGGWHIVSILFTGFTLGKRTALVTALGSGVILVSIRLHHLFANPARINVLDTPQLLIGSIINVALVLWFVYFMISQYIRSTDIAKKILLDQKRDIELANHAKDDFLSIMSHEIRTPLNAVIGTTNLLQDTPLDSEQSNYLNILKTASNNLLMLTNDILDFSKIEIGKLELEHKPFNLPQLITNSSNGFAALARDKGLDFHLEIAPSVPAFVFGDKLRIAQIINNLLSNAIKFTHKGEIHLKLSQVAILEGKAAIEIIVMDSGIGIHPKQLENIFDAFTQATNQDSSMYGGTGLGLTIVSRLAALMKGQVHVQSTPSVGSQFKVTLSLDASDETDQKDQLSQNITKNDQDIRILLAEDNEFNAIITTKLLEKWNFGFTHVVNGEEALRELDKKKYDLVLMDIQMPILTGYQAAEAIRNQDSAYSKIPIIALTADATSRTRDEVNRIGFNDLITKPFDPMQLRATIDRVLEQPPNEE